MLKKVAAAVLALVLLGPMLGLVGVGVLMNPAAANCVVPGGSVTVDRPLLTQVQ